MDDTDLEARDMTRQKRMLSWMFPKHVPPVPSPDERAKYPQNSANFLSQIFFWWLFPVMKRGYIRTLVPEDLFTLYDEIKVENMTVTFEAHFERLLLRARTKHRESKCKERGETPENSLIDFDADMEDFVVPKFIVVGALLRTFKWQYLAANICLALATVGQTTNPLLIKKLIEFVESRNLGIEHHAGKGIGYSFGAVAVLFTFGTLTNHCFYRAMMTGAEAKGVLTRAVLTKAFRLNAESRHKYSTGKITSIMGTDLARIDFAFGLQPFMLVFPIPFIIAIAILIVNIGAQALVGIGIMIAFMVGIVLSAKQLFGLRALANKYTDERVSYMKEALNNLKIIKYYAWEPPYHDNISSLRRREMLLIRKMQLLRNVITAFGMSMTLFASMVSFLVVYKTNESKGSPAALFSSISLFNVLSTLIFLLPMALSSGSDASVGLLRVGKYLASPEINIEAARIEADPEKKLDMQSKGTAIELTNASFEWETFDHDDEDDKDEKKDNGKKKGKDKKKAKGEDEGKQSEEDLSESPNDDEKSASDSDSPSKGIEKKTATEDAPFPGLQNIDLTIRKGEFIVITGLIGSGKSSLLSALSGFMKNTAGNIDVNGSLLLCATPWVQNATVKENILFGSALDEKKYKEVVYSCSLESDLDILPAGDSTEVGERGITLSGGQKARINLARAVYANRDIILLDDVLSAVDARVGKHIINNCLLGLLKDKTRILATHQLSLIGAADRIIFLNGDGTITVGTSDELKEISPGFANLMSFNAEEKDEDDDELDPKMELQDSEDDGPIEVTADDKYQDQEVHEHEREMIQRQVSRMTKSTIDEEANHIDYNENNTHSGKLITEEHKAVNRIDNSVYAKYLTIGSGNLGPWLVVPAFLMSIMLTTFFQLFTNTWLSFWSEKKFHGKSNNFYIGFYVAFTFLALFCILIEFIILVFITNTASVRLNVMAVGKILHAPMAFMDTTPMGRILNRFTKDTDVLDNEIGDQLRFFFVTGGNIVGVLILCVIYLPWFAIAIPFLGFAFISTADFYQASAREAKRIEAVQRSLVYNNFNETLSGMDTIRAYKDTDRFIAKNDQLVNTMNEAYFVTIANQRWLGINIDIISCLFSLLICLLCVCRVFHISPASSGLLMSYVFQISGQLSFLIRVYTQVENEMNAAERLIEYAYLLPQEAAYVVTETTPKDSWPEQGTIKFEEVNLAYRPGLPLVLKNLNFEVKPHEKVGICGRTGAGKSSIMTALYRLSELESGKITIDDVDVSHLGLKALRSKLSIIPQDPVLFRGSIRKNLDPFNESTDDKLWDALRRTGLIDALRMEAVKAQTKENTEDDNMHKFHLDQAVEDDGANFSLGERQLLAFARALVRDTKILILDEATSSVDYETDAKIQQTIIKEFSHCTILCIAHRLKTIINYDRILVLDKGEINQFDTPWNLFNDKDGIFQQMCQKSNITSADFADVQRF